MSYDATGALLQKTAEIMKNQQLIIRPAECISPGDAQAIDVYYHQKCWTNNVTNVLRKHRGANANYDQENITKILGSSTEFLVSFVNI